MTDDLCGHLRLKGDAAKLRGRRIGCGFGAESLTIKGEASTFLAVRRSAFGDDAPPTLTLSDGTSEVARNVDELFRGEASVVEAALDDTLKLWVEYIPAPPEPRRGDVVELEPWARGGAGSRATAPRTSPSTRPRTAVRVAWTPAPPAEPWQCNVTLPAGGARRAPGLVADAPRGRPRRSATPKPDGASRPSRTTSRRRWRPPSLRRAGLAVRRRCRHGGRGAGRRRPGPRPRHRSVCTHPCAPHGTRADTLWVQLIICN